MRKISPADFERILAAARVIEEDKFGPKVAITADGNYLKIFRRKRWLSTAAVYPYARRFCRNARRLPRLGIRTVKIVDICACPALGRHLVFYQPLAGETLSRVFTHDAARRQLLPELAAYIARLHHLGILFRSLHFGNLLRLPGGGFGLIDIADLTISRHPLNLGQRRRNFNHLLSRRREREVIAAFGPEKFLRCYLEHSNLPAAEQEKLAGACREHWPAAANQGEKTSLVSESPAR